MPLLLKDSAVEPQGSARKSCQNVEAWAAAGVAAREACCLCGGGRFPRPPMLANFVLPSWLHSPRRQSHFHMPMYIN